MKIVEDDGNLGHSLNLGDLDMYRIDFWVNGRRTRFLGLMLHGGMECPAKKHDSACAISPGGRKKGSMEYETR